ncbi:Polypyrimidine tract-binding protein 2 [Phytophthora boehmeriae]|uniref:Polypyrimidine tract-binding protein 2 n=1 Tax=Phytophthora boehmeriae TaxID=109152 RepID=A0A8T1X712_9STRA|nr:Polypyrimidine tract-binding protein 2 [Phytophthora boehmeriae]
MVPQQCQAFVQLPDISSAANLITFYQTRDAMIRGKKIYFEFSNRNEINGRSEYEAAPQQQQPQQFGQQFPPRTTDPYQPPSPRAPTYQQPPPSAAPYQQAPPSAAPYQQSSAAPYQQPPPSATPYQQQPPPMQRAQHHEMPPYRADVGGRGGMIQHDGPRRGIGPPNQILMVSVSKIEYDVTVDVLQQVFQKFGNVEKIVTFWKDNEFKSLVQMESIDQAQAAQAALDGREIYTGCNQLSIVFSRHPELRTGKIFLAGLDMTNHLLVGMILTIAHHPMHLAFVVATNMLPRCVTAEGPHRDLMMDLRIMIAHAISVVVASFHRTQLVVRYEATLVHLLA